MTTPLLKIVYQSPRVAVVDKPPGLLSVPGKGEANQDCVVSRLREHLPEATGPLVVHRLDMDTSGLLLLGLDPDAQRDLSAQFERRTVRKAYVALVEGLVSGESGIIDAPMRADIEHRPMQIIDPVQGRAAQTRWCLLAIETDRSRLALEPQTGRTHQLRLHLAHVGHPILGDVLYGPGTGTAPHRLCLHATELEFDEPGPRERTRILVRSPVPF